MNPIEVIAICCTLFSQYLLTNKNWLGFVISMCGNICWMIGVGAPSILVINSLFLLINIKGIYSYKFNK